MIDAMCEIYGSRRENIRVSIGPSIGPCCYEVRNQEQLDSFGYTILNKGEVGQLQFFRFPLFFFIDHGQGVFH